MSGTGPLISLPRHADAPAPVLSWGAGSARGGGAYFDLTLTFIIFLKQGLLKDIINKLYILARCPPVNARSLLRRESNFLIGRADAVLIAKVYSTQIRACVWRYLLWPL